MTPTKQLAIFKAWGPLFFQSNLFQSHIWISPLCTGWIRWRTTKKQNKLGLERITNEIMLKDSFHNQKCVLLRVCAHMCSSSYCRGGYRSGSISSFSPQQLLHRVFDSHSLVRLGCGRLWQCCTRNTADMSITHDKCTKKNPLRISCLCQVKQGVAESVESFSHSIDTAFIGTFRLFCIV